MIKKWIVVLGLFIVFSGCKSQVEDLAYDLDEYRMMEQDQQIRDLSALIVSMENEIQSLQVEKEADELNKKDLESQLAFIESQLIRLSAEYEALASSSNEKEDILNQALAQLQNDLKNELERGVVDYFVYQGMVVIHVNNPILFEPGQAEILEANRDVLLKIASFIKYFPDKIVRVEGHTATGPDSPRYPTAWELGAARAVNVTRFFQEEGRISPERLVAVSLGEWRPIASNETEEGKSRNRRIEIIVLNRPLYHWQDLQE